MSLLICPVCRSELKENSVSLVCANGHAYDIAKQGYVNLLPVNKKHSNVPGDSKEMILSRRSFLESGYYDCFASKLAEIIIIHTNHSQKLSVLDVGCGEGYYDGFLTKKLDKLKINYEFYGTDISKEAVKAASGKYKNVSYAVASNFSLPFKDKSFDIIINIFSPMAESENCRLLKENALYIYAVPGPDHLIQIKETIYDDVYQKEERDIAYSGLEFLERVKVRSEITVEGKDLTDLFMMTPYYLKSHKNATEKLKRAGTIKTKIAFDFLVFKKKGKNYEDN